jgi:hypothetical protein
LSKLSHALFFNKDYIKYEITDQSNLSQTDLLYSELKTLISQKKIYEAEDLLFEMLDTGDIRHLELAIDFYQQLNQLEDSELEQCNFSRDEVSDGLTAILKMFDMYSYVK